MIVWKRLEVDHYKSGDERFEIMQTYDRIYGDHWVLSNLRQNTPV